MEGINDINIFQQAIFQQAIFQQAIFQQAPRPDCEGFYVSSLNLRDGIVSHSLCGASREKVEASAGSNAAVRSFGNGRGG